MLENVIRVILVIIVLLLFTSRFWFPLVVKFVINKAAEKGNICDKCKGEMDEISTTLCLIPVSFDHEHDNTAQYYVENATPIADEKQIPTGQRACRMSILQCRNCGCKEVVVIDFLQVRDKEVYKGSGVFPYESFRRFFENLWNK